MLIICLFLYIRAYICLKTLDAYLWKEKHVLYKFWQENGDRERHVIACLFIMFGILEAEKNHYVSTKLYTSDNCVACIQVISF